ncbi:MAG TPA: phosphotransferase [Actinomycetota bacterium]|nr:phosphotransferase [Actinomycetota bacterium]
MEEELLTGGNTHEAVVRVGDTVRRPAGPWTPGVHALLRHLEAAGFDGAPRVLGVDELGREVLTFVEGDVVYPDHVDLIAPDEALAEVAGLVRAFHDAVAGFDGRGYEWSHRGSDGSGSGELVCHNDLAPWNLVRRPGGGWAFVDWDLAAPGSPDWDLAWALLTLIPLMPDSTIRADVPHRLGVFREAYGALDPGVLEVAVARCVREAHLIRTDPAYARLLAEGHDVIWADAGEHVARHLREWKGAL